MLKKIMLLLLFSMNLHAVRRLEDYKFSTVATTTTVVATVIIGSIIYSTSAEDRKIFFSKLCSGETEEINNVLMYGLAIAALTMGLLEIPVVCSMPQTIYEDICYSWFPTDEQKASIMKAREELEFVNARAKFRKCLFSSEIKSERSEFNCPHHCQALASEFVRCGGKDEMTEMIKNFDEYWK